VSAGPPPSPQLHALDSQACAIWPDWPVSPSCGDSRVNQILQAAAEVEADTGETAQRVLRTVAGLAERRQCWQQDVRLTGGS